ncbi:MAG: alpha-amylase family glycosyl hydrolase [Bacteroidales bacterium]|nr:alpha-amylase family glycosyl hydrolase [Bacteroidales bacterium]
MKKLYFLISIFALLLTNGFSQVITVTPALPTDQDSVEVIFDAALGNAGLLGYTGDIYAHTGVITNLSTSSSDWKYVKAGWTENIDVCKLTSLGNNLWKLIISPSIRDFYSVPAGEVIQKLAFVFRSSDGTKTGKTEAGGDIFYDVYPSSLSVSITNPTDNFIFVDLNQTIPVSVSSLFADSTLLYVDGLKVAATNTNQISTSVTASAYGQYLVKAIAKTNTAMVADSFYYYVRPAVPVADLPTGMKDGINYLSETSVLLCLYAPFKSFAYVIGDFNNWIPDQSSYMNRTTDGNRYWLKLDGLVAGKEYIFQYLVDNNIRIGDPYANKVSDPWNDQYISADTYPGLIPYPAGKTSGIATVFQTAQKPYIWKSATFAPPAKTDLVIYELLVRDFTDKHTFQSVIDTIGYLHTLGINAIELMPVSEFEGNLSWGYNPNYYFAVDKYYGNQDKLKQLVDTCHQLGIAVIGDMVLNHSYGTSPLVMLYWDAANSRPAANNPWYNVTSPNTSYSWGSDFNHESADTKKLVDSITSYWMSEFHLDGFRFDFTKGFTNTVGDGWAYDASRIAILERMATEMWKRNPNAYVIFEHLSDNSEEKVLANFGIMLWGNMNYNYNEAAKGVIANSNFGQVSYLARGWSKPHLISYMESHDEERQMYACITAGRSGGIYFITDTATALKRAALTATFFLTIPGPKMIWQFGERGYDYSINYDADGTPDRLASKPPRWDYMSKAERVQLYAEYSKLITLKKKYPLFSTTDFQLNVSEAVKKIYLTSGDKSAVILGNFGVVSTNVSPGFPHTGKWYDYISGDSLVVTDVNYNLIFKPGEYRVYLTEKFTESYGIFETQKDPFSVVVSPNPVSDVCTIKILYAGSASCEIKDFTLSGSETEKVYSGNINTNLQMPWKPKGKGIHILKVRIGNQQVSRKVIVQ